jgi:hypothetical protein
VEEKVREGERGGRVRSRTFVLESSFLFQLSSGLSTILSLAALSGGTKDEKHYLIFRFFSTVLL